MEGLHVRSRKRGHHHIRKSDLSFYPRTHRKIGRQVLWPWIPQNGLYLEQYIFYKPTDHRIEREFRLLRNLDENARVNLTDPADHGRYVPIRLKKIIHRVITHPNASRVFKKEVEALLQKHIKHRQREDSALL